MMCHIIEHLVSGLLNDLELKKEEYAARTKSKDQLHRLLAEMVETERKYVQDLEQACDYYLPLARIVDHRKIQSLDRQQMKNKKRKKSQCSSMGTKCSSQEFFYQLTLESGDNMTPLE
jgi:hypothetical protein